MKWTPSLTATLLFAGVAAAAPQVAPGPRPAAPSRVTGARPVAPARTAARAEAVAGSRGTYALAALAPLLAHVEFVSANELVELRKIKLQPDLSTEDRARIEELAERSRKLAEELSALQGERTLTEQQNARLQELLQLQKNAVRLRELAGAPGNTPFAASALLDSLGVRQFQQRIDLDLKDADVQEAAQQILKQSGLEAALQVDELPTPTRLTLQVKGVKAATALDLVADAAGVRWGLERKDGKTTLHLGKDAGLPFYRASAGGSPAGTAFVFRDGKPSEPVFVPLERLPYGVGTVQVAPSTIARFSFTCPHCSGRVSMIRRSTDPDCSKCGQRFQRDWKFCPTDGTRRPSPQPDVKFCPLCGKRVEMEQSSSPDAGTPVVSDVKEEDAVVFQLEGDTRRPLIPVDPDRPFVLTEPVPRE